MMATEIETIKLTSESVRSDKLYVDQDGDSFSSPQELVDCNQLKTGDIYADEYQFVRRVRIVDERGA
jgi:hypothetical protein